MFRLLTKPDSFCAMGFPLGQWEIDYLFPHTNIYSARTSSHGARSGTGYAISSKNTFA